MSLTHDPVLICGAPRTGSSLLAEIMIKLGYYPGPKSKVASIPQYGNPSGVLEHIDAFNICQDIMVDMGGLPGGVVTLPYETLPDRWYEDPKYDKYDARIRSLFADIAKRAKSNHIGIFTKAQWSIFVLPIWLRALPPNLKILFTERDPFANYDSMIEKGSNPEHTMEAIVVRNLQYERWHLPKTACRIQYELWFEDNMPEQASRMADYLNLDAQDIISIVHDIVKPEYNHGDRRTKWQSKPES